MESILLFPPAVSFYLFLFLLPLGVKISAEPLSETSSVVSSFEYREICMKAASDDKVFKVFRSLPHYCSMVECQNEEDYADYILRNACLQTKALLPILKRIDLVGQPIVKDLPSFGKCSGTTLRYIVFGDLIRRIFELPKNPTIVEIGAGFGGQAYVLSHLINYSKYYIYDLPEAEFLIDRVRTELEIPGICLLDISEKLPEEEIDLFISNYAFSKLDKSSQMSYFNRIIAKSKNGFLLFSNNKGPFDHLALIEFTKMLFALNKNPIIYPDPVPRDSSDARDVIVTWGPKSF